MAQESRAVRLALILLFASGSTFPGAASSRTLVGLRGRDTAGLDRLLAAQQDPSSPDYRRWLAPQEFGRRFGASAGDLRRVERWLRNAGCRVRRATGRQQVECVGGHPGLPPADVAPLVDGLVDLDTPIPIEHALDTSTLERRSVAPGGQFYFSPEEYAGFYGFDGLHQAGVTGAGQRIGIVGTVPVDTSDVALFRSQFGLPPLELEQVGTPGTNVDETDAVEAILDVTWSGAVAPGAAIVLAISRGTVVDAIRTLVNRPDVSVISLSVNPIPSPQTQGVIRQSLRLFKQAASQGQTVLMASGDFGSRVTGTSKRRGVNPYAQSPFVTGVGGTSPSAASPEDAFDYGNEVVWQDGPMASGGGASTIRKPSWQKGLPGRTRTVPDVSLAASPVYPVPSGGRIACCVAGTSAAAPSWAGLIAMLNQQRGTRAGLLNPTLYALGNAQAQGGAAVFHDVVTGSSDTTKAKGFPAKPGYDLATGWGSPRVAELFAAFK